MNVNLKLAFSIRQCVKNHLLKTQKSTHNYNINSLNTCKFQSTYTTTSTNIKSSTNILINSIRQDYTRNISLIKQINNNYQQQYVRRFSILTRKLNIDNSQTTENKASSGQQEQEQQQQQEQKQKDTEKKTGLARMFARENAWKFSLGFILLSGAVGGVYVLLVWGAPEQDQFGNLIKDEFSNQPFYLQYPKRALNSGFQYYQMLRDPSSDKLLPDPMQEPFYQPPYTLVIELSGVLIHPEWTYSTGWRYKKRPGLEFFLDQVKYPLFEVVFFTRESSVSFAPVAYALDPEGKIQFKLFRESTKFMNGMHVKDLSCLNRDVRKIILIDADSNAFQLQPRNALHRLKEWKGEEDDTDLVYLAQFLKTIATSGVEDVREVMDYYNKEINPLEAFKINHVRLREAEEEKQRELKEWKQKQVSGPLAWIKKLH